MPLWASGPAYQPRRQRVRRRRGHAVALADRVEELLRAEPRRRKGAFACLSRMAPAEEAGQQRPGEPGLFVALRAEQG